MSSPPAFFDTHAHLHDPWIGDDLPEVMARASEAGVERIVTIGCSLEDSRNAIAVAEQYDNVWATVGLHPHDAKDWSADLEAEFRRLAAHERVVAIGEIGLDFYRNLSPHSDQYRAFEGQLGLADELELPVVIHSRDAHEDTFGLLEDWAQSHSPPALRGEMSRSDRGGSPRSHPLLLRGRRPRPPLPRPRLPHLLRRPRHLPQERRPPRSRQAPSPSKPSSSKPTPPTSAPNPAEANETNPPTSASRLSRSRRFGASQSD